MPTEQVNVRLVDGPHAGKELTLNRLPKVVYAPDMAGYDHRIAFVQLTYVCVDRDGDTYLFAHDTTSYASTR